MGLWSETDDSEDRWRDVFTFIGEDLNLESASLRGSFRDSTGTVLDRVVNEKSEERERKGVMGRHLVEGGEWPDASWVSSLKLRIG
jgi:hypothetical protein